MNRLSAILPTADVLVDVDVANRERLFEQAGVLFEVRHGMARATIADNLMVRERLGSTALGHGVAIPHCRIEKLKEPLAAVLRLRQPIAFDSPDLLPVGLFVFLFVPGSANQRHLEILSEIAEMLSDRGMRDRLRAANDAAALHRAIAAWSAAPSIT